MMNTLLMIYQSFLLKNRPENHYLLFPCERIKGSDGTWRNYRYDNPAGKLIFGIFTALAEFERELIAKRTVAGLASARARGRKGRRPYKMTPVKLRFAMASMGHPETKVCTLCQEWNNPPNAVPTYFTGWSIAG